MGCPVVAFTAFDTAYFHTEPTNKTQNKGNCQYIKYFNKRQKYYCNISSEVRKFNLKIFGMEYSLSIERESILSSSCILGQTISFLNQKKKGYFKDTL